MMVAGESRINGSRRSKRQGSVSPAVNLSGKRAAAGQNSEKLIEAPKEQYFRTNARQAFEDNRISQVKKQRKMTIVICHFSLFFYARCIAQYCSESEGALSLKMMFRPMECIVY